jgi:hypothetical protein
MASIQCAAIYVVAAEFLASFNNRGDFCMKRRIVRSLHMPMIGADNFTIFNYDCAKVIRFFAFVPNFLSFP